MESNMVINTAQMYCDIVEVFFEQNLPNFSLVSKYVYSPYWSVIFELPCITIKIGGDLGFSIELLIENTEFHMWQYDRTVNNKMTTSEENVIYQLNILKRFLNEVGC